MMRVCRKCWRHTYNYIVKNFGGRIEPLITYASLNYHLAEGVNYLKIKYLNHPHYVDPILKCRKSISRYYHTHTNFGAWYLQYDHQLLQCCLGCYPDYCLGSRYCTEYYRKYLILTWRLFIRKIFGINASQGCQGGYSSIRWGRPADYWR
jgi:hypothetical protein